MVAVAVPRPASLPEFPAGTKFGLVDGAPWSFEEGSTYNARDWSGASPRFVSASRFREDAELVSEDAFRRAVAASHAG